MTSTNSEARKRQEERVRLARSVGVDDSSSVEYHLATYGNRTALQQLEDMAGWMESIVNGVCANAELCAKRALAEYELWRKVQEHLRALDLAKASIAEQLSGNAGTVSMSAIRDQQPVFEGEDANA